MPAVSELDTAGSVSFIWFSDFNIHIDKSYKTAERMHTILGDVFVGGNVVVDKGFVIAKLKSST